MLKKYPTLKKLANLFKLTGILWDSSNGRFGEWEAKELKSFAHDEFKKWLAGS